MDTKVFKRALKKEYASLSPDEAEILWYRLLSNEEFRRAYFTKGDFSHDAAVALSHVIYSRRYPLSVKERAAKTAELDSLLDREEKMAPKDVEAVATRERIDQLVDLLDIDLGESDDAGSESVSDSAGTDK
jgi:hypothetical protein